MPKKTNSGKGGIKVPYPILLGIRKKAKQREEKKREWARATGGYMPAKRKRKDTLTKDEMLKREIGDRRGMRGLGDGSRGLRPTMGKYSKGILYVSKKEIGEVTGSRTFEESRRPALDKTPVPSSGKAKKKKKKKKKGKGRR